MNRLFKSICGLLAGIVIFAFTSCRSDSGSNFGFLMDYFDKGSGANGVTSDCVSFAKSLKAGFNLGNTLDACSNYSGSDNLGLSTEISWGLPYTTRPMINAVAAAGFTSIRIPVSWHNHITDRNGYVIASEWMARVKLLVDRSLSAGLYVIINIHHDNLSEAQMQENAGFAVSSEPEVQTASKAYLKAVWEQISSVFADYDNHLIFEVLNEPRVVGESYEWYGSDNEISPANRIICDYEKVCLDAIRSSGGNNAYRFVMIPTYAANPSLTAGWSLPSDSVSGRLLVSVHSYDPSDFGLGDSSGTVLPSYAENLISELYKGLAERFMNKGIGVVVGETSCSDKNNYEERKKWFRLVKNYASMSGIPYVLWDNDVVYPNGDNAGERHGYFNRKNLSWYFPELIGIFVR